MNSVIKSFFILAVIWVGFGCSLNFKTNVKPIAATVTELSACRKDGKPAEVFSPDEEHIFVCGHIETLQPVDINLYWYYEDELVFQQDGEDVDGDFHSFLTPGEKMEAFPTGAYRIDVLIGGVVTRSTKFRVEEP
jgi:hypothetical protein